MGHGCGDWNENEPDNIGSIWTLSHYLKGLEGLEAWPYWRKDLRLVGGGFWSFKSPYQGQSLSVFLSICLSCLSVSPSLSLSSLCLQILMQLTTNSPTPAYAYLQVPAMIVMAYTSGIVIRLSIKCFLLWELLWSVMDTWIRLDLFVLSSCKQIFSDSYVLKY